MGADAFLGLPKWHRAAQLFQVAEWIVVSRPGFALGSLDALQFTAAQRARVHLLDGVADETSATRLRRQLHLDRCEGLLPKQLCDFIRVHGLYRG